MSKYHKVKASCQTIEKPPALLWRLSATWNAYVHLCDIFTIVSVVSINRLPTKVLRKLRLFIAFLWSDLLAEVKCRGLLTFTQCQASPARSDLQGGSPGESAGPSLAVSFGAGLGQLAPKHWSSPKAPRGPLSAEDGDPEAPSLDNIKVTVSPALLYTIAHRRRAKGLFRHQPRTAGAGRGARWRRRHSPSPSLQKELPN